MKSTKRLDKTKKCGSDLFNQGRFMAGLKWEDKEKRIREKHPEALDVSWDKVLQGDPDFFAQVIGDVVKSGAPSNGPGKRPSLDDKQAFAIYSRLAGEDFASGDFFDAFEALVAGRSVRSVANKTGLASSFIFKLLKRQTNPSFETMEKIAAGFKKDPSYFLEYRIGYVLSTIEAFLTDSPETASGWFLEVKNS